MKDSLEDLSARARRQELTEAEARRLEQMLESSSEDRLWHRAGSEFDAQDAVLPGDHAATERVIERLLKRTRSPAAPSRARLVALLVAAAVLVVSVAAAAVVGVRALQQRRLDEQKVMRAPTASRGGAQRGLPSAAPLGVLPNTVAPEAPASADAQPIAEAPAPLHGGPAPSVSSEPQTPADLLSAAGQARRQGYSGRAIGLLNTLQTRFPNSPEAHSSDITLGMLQLKSGAAGAASLHFDRYLQRSPHGALASEALWGKAQAAFAQGDEATGRRSLTALLERYPGSPYASAARAKLHSGAPEP